MALQQVTITSDALLTCMIHAFSTEREEVMGLLIGNSDERRECRIFTVFPMPRSDKRRDRVEVSEENLISASTQCEKLSAQLKVSLRVVGWFHSHPHITVWPSHVDLRTQAMYQMLEPNYVGLIISTFNTDKQTKANRLEMVAFQSVARTAGSNEYERVEIPIYVAPQVLDFDALSARERSSSFLRDVQTRTSESARQRDPDSILLSEAERAVAYSFGGATANVSLSPNCLVALCEVAGLFSNEETVAFARANEPQPNGADATGETDVLARIYNSSVYSAFMSQLLSTFELPLVAALRSQRATLDAECEHLERRRDRLRRELNNLRR